MKTVNIFESKMKMLAGYNNLEFKKCTEHHFQLKGIFLINIYPTKNKYYVQGSEKGIGYRSLDELIQICIGEKNTPKAKDKTERKHLSHKKPILWKQSKHCFFCGEEFKSMAEATIEHKIPLSRGGSNRIDNLALSHDGCNQGRGNDLAVEVSVNEKRLIDEKNKLTKENQELRTALDYLTINIKQSHEMNTPVHINTYERAFIYRCEFNIENQGKVKNE